MENEIKYCPTCGAVAKKVSTNRLKCIDSIDGQAWAAMNKIITDAKNVYAGYPSELDAIEYIYQRLKD